MYARDERRRAGWLAGSKIRADEFPGSPRAAEAMTRSDGERGRGGGGERGKGMESMAGQDNSGA